MIGSNDTGRRIDAWMEAEAPLRAPVEILETVFATTSQASQRRAFPAFVGLRFGALGSATGASPSWRSPSWGW